MYNFGRYASFATTHDFVSWRHFFIWGCNSKSNVESLMIILSSSFLDSLSPPFSVSLTRLLWSYLTDTCNNNFGASCASLRPSIFTFRQSLKIVDCTNCGWCIIQLQRYFFIFSWFFNYLFCFVSMYMVYFHI